jgi:hypothetical protein
MFTEAETVVRVADLEITGLEERLSSILDCENTEMVTISSARLHRKQLRGVDSIEANNGSANGSICERPLTSNEEVPNEPSVQRESRSDNDSADRHLT